MNHTRVLQAVLCAFVGVVMGGTAAVGVFFRGTGATVESTTIRGEKVQWVTDGVYAWNAQRVVAEGVGWDWFTLVVAAPALLVAVPLVARGSLRGRLFAVGVLGYAFYQYLMYAMTWALGPLFPVFIVIYAASLTGIGWIASGISLDELHARTGPAFPRKGMAILSAFLALTLVGMWTTRIAAGLREDWANASLAGTTTLVVQALDLGLVVPLALWTAVMAWRGRPMGTLLSSIFVVKGVAMAAAICAMLISAAVVEGKLEVPPFVLFGGATLAQLWLGTKMYRNISASAASAATT